MKFLHLADLHLGKRVNGFSMLEDQAHILRQILAILDDEQPDSVLIAGDVYDKSVPSVEAVGLLDGFLHHPDRTDRRPGACHQRQPRLAGAARLRRARHG